VGRSFRGRQGSGIGGSVTALLAFVAVGFLAVVLPDLAGTEDEQTVGT
jgi:hypothetical protein